MNNQKGILIGYININRLINKINDVYLLLIQKDLDILFVSETFLQPHITDSFITLPHYNLIRIDRDYQNGGGIVCYYKNNYNISILSMSIHQNIEYLNILLKLSDASCFAICGIYRKPSSDISFFELFNNIYSPILLNYKTYILGDFNICLIKKHYPYTHLKKFVKNNNLKQLIESPTHSTNIIDHIYTNSIQNTTYHTSYGVCFTDHHLIYFNIKKNKNLCVLPQKIFTSNYLFKYTDASFLEKLHNKLSSFDYSNKNVDLSTLNFIDSFTSITNSFMKTKINNYSKHYYTRCV
jgi:hypothetical protein